MSIRQTWFPLVYTIFNCYLSREQPWLIAVVTTRKCSDLDQ